MLVKKRNTRKNISEKKPKSPRQIERHVKGVANHRRIEILFIIAENSGITVEEISKRTNSNFKTISEHIIRMTNAGLIRKGNRGRMVVHEISPYGKIFYKFLTTFRHS
jgi:predicted transcriptional regulator